MTTSESLEHELGQQRIAQLRALIEQTPSGKMLFPGGMMVPVQGGWNLPYVALTGPELAAMLDRLVGPAIKPDVDT